MRRDDLAAQIRGKNVDTNIMMGTYTEAEGRSKIRGTCFAEAIIFRL
jgi:hypothetical protein